MQVLQAKHPCMIRLSYLPSLSTYWLLPTGLYLWVQRAAVNLAPCSEYIALGLGLDWPDSGVLTWAFKQRHLSSSTQLAT